MESDKRTHEHPSDPIVVIAVLGHALQNGNQPSQEMLERVQAGYDIFHELSKHHGKNCVLLFSGGNTQETISEAESMQQIVIQRYHVKPKYIILEDKSQDTIQNALGIREQIFYSQKDLHPRATKSKYVQLIVVTSKYHKKRANLVFRSVFGEKELKRLQNERPFRYQLWHSQPIVVVAAWTEQDPSPDSLIREQRIIAHIHEMLAAYSIELVPYNSTPHKRNVYFVRHCESLYNEASRAAHTPLFKDTQFIDARLSNNGQKEAEEVGKVISEIKVNLLVVSPLSRALQTAAAILQYQSPTTCILPEISEFRYATCDFGRPTSVLKQEFVQYSFDEIPDVWQPQYPERENEALLQWLWARPVENIVVVSHGHYLRRFLGEPHMKNGQIRAFEITINNNAPELVEKQQILPPIPQLAKQILNPKAQRKFHEDRTFDIFKGNTVICFLSKQDPQFNMLVEIQNKLKALPFADCYAFLPPSSLHTTILGIKSQHVSSDNYLSKRKGVVSATESILMSAPWTTFRFEFASLPDTAWSIYLKPVGKSGALDAFVRALAKAVNQPVPDGYTFHITLAYQLYSIPPEHRPLLQSFNAKMTRHLQKHFGTLELGMPTLASYNDMSEFRPISRPLDFGLVVTVESIPKWPTVVRKLRISDQGQFVDVTESNFSKHPDKYWSACCVLHHQKHDNVPYLMMYDQLTGTAYGVEIQSSYHDLERVHHFHINVGQEWSHMNTFGKLPLLLLYSQAKGSVKILDSLHSNSFVEFQIDNGYSNLMTFALKDCPYILAYQQKNGSASLIEVSPQQLTTIKTFKKWNTQWTNFVSFTFKSCTYYLAYQARTGLVNITQITEEWNLKNVCKFPWPCNIEHLVVFYMDNIPHLAAYQPTNQTLAIFRVQCTENPWRVVELKALKLKMQSMAHMMFVDLSL